MFCHCSVRPDFDTSEERCRASYCPLVTGLIWKTLDVSSGLLVPSVACIDLHVDLLLLEVRSKHHEASALMVSSIVLEG